MANTKNKVRNRSEAPAAARSSDSRGASQNCVVAKGTKIEGDFNSTEDVRMDGQIVGDIRCEKKIVLGEEGSVEGKIEAANAVIMGKVKGDVQISELLQLVSSSQIEGNITAKRITVEEGARYSGECKVG